MWVVKRKDRLNGTFPYDPVPNDPVPHDPVPFDPVSYDPVPYDPVPKYPEHVYVCVSLCILVHFKKNLDVFVGAF